MSFFCLYFDDIKFKSHQFNGILKGFNEIKEGFYEITLPIGLHNKLIMKLHHIDKDIKISHNAYPLVFLLLCCDAIQDWGRTKQQNNSFELIKFKIYGKKIIAEYSVPPQPDMNTILSKIAELKRTSTYLNISDFSFIIWFGEKGKYGKFNVGK